MSRKNDNRKLEYDEHAMKLGIRLYKEGEIPLELLYHLMKNQRLKSFSAIMLQSGMEGFDTFLQTHKRSTDLFHVIDREENIYALLCQETQVDGGFYFIKRLAKLAEDQGEKEIRAAIIGVESTNYSVKDLIFIILDTFVRTGNPESSEKIIFRTIR